MTQKENYVHQVFMTELGKYPRFMHEKVSVPTAERFDIEYVPPQFKPDKVYQDMPKLYQQMHKYIIDSMLNEFFRKKHETLEKNLYNYIKNLEIDDIQSMVNKYLSLAGKEYEIAGDWDFFDRKDFKQFIRRRVKYMVNDLREVVRHCLNDVAYKNKNVPKDVQIFMKMMLNVN